MLVYKKLLTLTRIYSFFLKIFYEHFLFYISISTNTVDLQPNISIEIARYGIIADETLHQRPNNAEINNCRSLCKLEKSYS